MRISHANIPAPASKSSLTHNSAATDKLTSRRQAEQANDRYQQNSNPQIIDAEFVEFYTPSTNLFAKELHNLDATLDPNDRPKAAETNSEFSEISAVKRYQLTAHNAPPPGSFLDTYA